MCHLARHRALLLIAAAACATAASQDPWIKIASPNFELYTSGGERSGRDLVRHFEQVRSFFLEAFGNGLPDAKPACIIAFRDEKEFEQYRSGEFAAAFMQPGPWRDFIVMSNGAIENYPVATHEFTHMMVHQSGREYPTWFNEGLAELFSNLRPMGNKIVAGQYIPGRMMTLEREGWAPLGTLLSADRKSPYYNDKSKVGVFYAESWALVHMLFLDPAYRPQLKGLNEALKQADQAAALEALYHKSLTAIEADLRSSLRGGSTNVMVFNLQLAKAVETPQVEAGAGLGARLALAELLSITPGRSERAEAAYASLSKEHPDRWEVEAGWGQFGWQQRNLDEAAHHYARAVELGGKTPHLLLDYGRVLDYTGRSADAIDILGKANRIDPDNDEIRCELGSAYLRHGNFGAAAAQLREVKKVAPSGAFRYFHDLAWAEYRIDDTAEALTHAAKARAFAHRADEMAALESLDQALERRAVGTVAGGAGPNGGEAAVAPVPAYHAPAKRDEAQLQAKPALPSVEGTFEHLECGKTARLHVRVGDAVRIFVITNPDSVAIRSGNGAPVDLQCGPQKPPSAVRIEYQPGQADAAGLVRSLEFK